MAYPSSFLSCNYKFDVFASFLGADVRKTFISHIREQFKRNGIIMFNDEEIERSSTIASSLKAAIKESRISIVILSKNYASSSWCLDELVEIMDCKIGMGQSVMTIFYNVDPSDVRKQIGEFGIGFNETCAHWTHKERQKWSKALNEVSNIAGEDFIRWDNEAKMIEKIAKDVSNKLNATPSRDFDGIVGLEDHLREVESLLNLDYDGVKMVAISGPAGIGKTTIARALQSRLANQFHLTCFVDNLRGSYVCGLDELHLQEKFLCKVFNQTGIRICHSGVIEERLCKQRVLIILDDVNHIKQLDALANETSWFGPGSRIVVTTEDKEILQQHGINNTYHVSFPSDEQAFKILCLNAFRKNSLYHGFQKPILRVMKLCGNLPLGLRVVGSSLRGKNEEEWEEVICRLEANLDRDIEDVLRVGYESLHENEQSLFLHIAVFFNYKDGALVRAMFTGKNYSIKHSLKILENKSLIYISTKGEVGMYSLLQQMGRQAIRRQEPWRRQILIDAPEICDVLEHAKGTRAISGISFDTSDIDEVSISKKAFKRMANLRFLKVYKSRDDGNSTMKIPEEMEFPRRLRLLHWEAYPNKSLPSTFHPEYLVELYMVNSKVQKLWEGVQPLTNLKKMNLLESKNLKELPDLSNATNLEDMNLYSCESLVEIPSSFSRLHKLQRLYIKGCTNLREIPAHMNLRSLETLYMCGCSRLRNIPVISTHIKELIISQTEAESMSPSIQFCFRLERICSIRSSGKLKGITHLPRSLKQLDLMDSDTEILPDCIKALPLLYILNLSGCRRLASLPELPSSLRFLMADDCESLETVFYPLNTPNAHLNLTNCFKLSQQARRTIIQRSFLLGTTLLPGKEVPAEFNHRGKGNSLAIRPDILFVVCVVISPNQNLTHRLPQLMCRRIGQGQIDPVDMVLYVRTLLDFQTEHLLVFSIHPRLLFVDPSEVNKEIVFEFSSKFQQFEVIECGAKILTDQSITGSYESGLDQVLTDDTDYSDHTNCWSSLFFCFGLFHIVKEVGSLVLRRRR